MFVSSSREFKHELPLACAVVDHDTPMLHVFVDAEGLKIALTIPPSDTVKALKQDLRHIFRRSHEGGIRDAISSISCGGKHLCDDLTISDYDIKNNATLQVKFAFQDCGPGYFYRRLRLNCVGLSYEGLFIASDVPIDGVDPIGIPTFSLKFSSHRIVNRLACDPSRVIVLELAPRFRQLSFADVVARLDDEREMNAAVWPDSAVNSNDGMARTMSWCKLSDAEAIPCDVVASTQLGAVFHELKVTATPVGGYLKPATLYAVAVLHLMQDGCGRDGCCDCCSYVKDDLILPFKTAAVVQDAAVVAGAIADALCCPICFEMCFEPTTTPCGHNFCMGCLNTWLESYPDTERHCPTCRFRLPRRLALCINTGLKGVIEAAHRARAPPPPPPPAPWCLSA